MSGRWTVERAVGSAAAFHARPLPAAASPAAWVHVVDRPALVLGSTQPDEHVDAAAADARGVEVVRRRSGGGAVLLVPGEALWIDFVVPAGDVLFDADVVRASQWVGELWHEALAAAGIDGVAVHRGTLVRRPWSERICFAGLGPGELTRAGAKVVGISQRRTRAAARFQTVVLARFDIDALADLLAPPRPSTAERAAVTAAVHPVDVPLGVLEAALLTALAVR